MTFYEQTTQLKSACEKEIQDIQHKYDMLLKEAGNALLHKKLEMESLYRKVYANKLLADTLKSSNEKLTSCPMSQGMQRDHFLALRDLYEVEW